MPQPENCITMLAEQVSLFRRPHPPTAECTFLFPGKKTHTSGVTYRIHATPPDLPEHSLLLIPR